MGRIFNLAILCLAMNASADEALSARVLGRDVWVTEVTTEVELGPKYRTASNWWLNEELASSLRESVVAALDREVFRRVRDVESRRPVAVKLTLSDRDFTELPPRRTHFVRGAMSLIVAARASLSAPDGRDLGTLPFLFVAFRDAPEPIFGEGVLIKIGSAQPDSVLKFKDVATAGDEFLRAFRAENRACARWLGE